jgi:dTDP-4-amino-4,6-dideoxygalactose transaminase
MIHWYGKVVRDPLDLAPVHAACDYFEEEYLNAVQEVDIKQMRGMRVDEVEKRLPGIVGYRYAQLQEIEAILGYIQIRETAIKGMRRRHYLEHYNRALTPTTAEKYVEADDEVLAMALLRNRVALTRNRFLGLTKEHECLHFQLTNISKLLAAGVDDAVM